MRYAYPCTLVPDEDGRLVVHFPDLPEALTDGAGRDEALAEARDCLAAAVGFRIVDRRGIPAPSRAGPGQVLVPVAPVLAAKLALYQAMREQGVTKTALADRLGVTEAAVRKLLDPGHRSHIGQVEAALRLLGRELVTEDRAAYRGA